MVDGVVVLRVVATDLMILMGGSTVVVATGQGTYRSRESTMVEAGVAAT
jgi:hypothetical protein